MAGKINLETACMRLKQFVSQFNSKYFLGELSSMKLWINPSMPPTPALQGFHSPLRQFFYLGALNVTSAQPAAETVQMSDEDLDTIKLLLNDVTAGYDQLFQPPEGKEISDEWLEKIEVARPAFHSYFYQGLLNYEEQILERVERYFKRFDAQIEAHFGLKVEDFITIYNWIDAHPNNYLMENVNRKEGEQSWPEFVDEMKRKGLPPWEWQKHMPRTERGFMEFISDKGQLHRFKRSFMERVFGKEKSERFLAIFTCEREETDFLYFTQENILTLKPIFQIDQDTFQVFDENYLIQAVYNVLTKFCLGDQKTANAFTKHRGNELEKKVKELFKVFLGQQAIVHESYFTDDKKEQDVLILEKGHAFIIEAKADKLDEPRRDPGKAYPILLQNFKAVVQRAYDQAYRVKSAFIYRSKLSLYKDESLKKHIVDINTKNYHKSFSIIVTLERFGRIQMDLTGALEVYDDDSMPWSVCIDDLEMFLLVLRKQGKGFGDFVKYLEVNAQLQGRIYAHDETEIMGCFIAGKFTKAALDSEDIFRLPHSCSDIFDELYNYDKLGFTNEKNVDLKRDARYLKLGAIFPGPIMSKMSHQGKK